MKLSIIIQIIVIFAIILIAVLPNWGNRRKENRAMKQYLDLTQRTELLPPWIVFPNMFQGSPRWNQGYEEDYCCNYWIPYWKNMSDEEERVYFAKYNVPSEWTDWLNEHKKIFPESGY